MKQNRPEEIGAAETRPRWRVVSEQFVKNILLLPVRFVMFIVNSIADTFKFSLSYRIGLIYTLLTAVILVAFNVGFSGGFRYLLQRDEIAQLNRLNEGYIAILQNRQTLDLTPIDDYVTAAQLSLNIYDASNHIVATTDGQLPLLAFDFREAQAVKVKRGTRRYLVTSRAFQQNGQRYYLQVVKDVTSSDKLLDRISYISAFLTALMLFLTLYLGSKISVQLLSPIKRMTDQIKQITIKRLDYRLDSSNAQDELKDLTLQFNSLLDQIETAYGRQNQFVSDASHELRTPISVINGYVGMLDRWGKRDPTVLDESIQAIKDETSQMQELIEKLLFLARSDHNKIEMDVAQLALDELVAELCRETEMIDQTHRIHCEIEGPAQIEGNAKMIKQMMRIFIENALKFTDSNGDVAIGLRSVGDKAILTVRDNGIGIAKEDLPKIFDRFYRTDKSRNKSHGGSGLGLSIAKWIIDEHRAMVRIYSEPGVGTKVEIWFDLIGV